MAGRPLTVGEKALARTVFPEHTIDLDSIRISSAAWVNLAGIATPAGVVIAPDGNIYFSPKGPNENYGDSALIDIRPA